MTTIPDATPQAQRRSLHWHAQLTFKQELWQGLRPDGSDQWVRSIRYTVRGFDAPGGWDRKASPLVMLHVSLDPDSSTAFVSANMARSTQEMRLADWVGLVRFLRDEHGVRVINADRDGRFRSWPTAAA